MVFARTDGRRRCSQRAVFIFGHRAMLPFWHEARWSITSKACTSCGNADARQTSGRQTIAITTGLAAVSDRVWQNRAAARLAARRSTSLSKPLVLTESCSEGWCTNTTNSTSYTRSSEGVSTYNEAAQACSTAFFARPRRIVLFECSTSSLPCTHPQANRHINRGSAQTSVKKGE